MAGHFRLISRNMLAKVFLAVDQRSAVLGRAISESTDTLTGIIPHSANRKARAGAVHPGNPIAQHGRFQQ